MTESDWLACTDPQPMLEFLRGKVSDRKLRLFLIECCRATHDLLLDSSSTQAVDVADQLLDGIVAEEERKAVGVAAWKVTTPHGGQYAAAYLAARSLDENIMTNWGYADHMALVSLGRHSTCLPGSRQAILL